MNHKFSHYGNIHKVVVSDSVPQGTWSGVWAGDEVIFFAGSSYVVPAKYTLRSMGTPCKVTVTADGVIEVEVTETQA